MNNDNYNVFNCPHCNLKILIYYNELNCCIFRHGIEKSTNNQINPHLCKEQCDYLKTNDLIFGCGKPFRIIKKNNNYEIEKCDYI